jgi:hypothetical protein
MPFVFVKNVRLHSVVIFIVYDQLFFCIFCIDGSYFFLAKCSIRGVSLPCPDFTTLTKKFPLYVKLDS